MLVLDRKSQSVTSLGKLFCQFPFPSCLFAFNKGVAKKKLNPVALVRKRTIPTERPLLVGEVSANFCKYRVLRRQGNEFPRPLISVL
jgi:hypothetical protein